MKIAVLGAGFCGLAVTWHLLQKNPQIKIEVFDPKGIGGEASGIAAGLLHPYGGAHAKLNWMGQEGLLATTALLNVASQTLGHPVFRHEGILRPATTTEQQDDFTRAASQYHDIAWLDASQCQSLVPGIVASPGILIRSGVSIYSKQYLKGLWLACERAGAVLYQEAVTDLRQFADYEAAVISTGAGIARLPEASRLSYNLIKGQVLELAWPVGLPPLHLPLNSQAYLLMSEDRKTCFAGATFERDFTSDQPDLAAAKREILPKLFDIYPLLKNAEIVGCTAGLRVTTPDRRPIVGPLQGNLWILSGMGSKGLLHHALMADNLARQICSSR